jgi:hypothetical protein
MPSVIIQYLPDLDETRVYDIADDGETSCREVRDGQGHVVPGQAGKSMAAVEAARPRPRQGQGGGQGGQGQGQP